MAIVAMAGFALVAFLALRTIKSAADQWDWNKFKGATAIYFTFLVLALFAGCLNSKQASSDDNYGKYQIQLFSQYYDEIEKNPSSTFLIFADDYKIDLENETLTVESKHFGFGNIKEVGLSALNLTQPSRLTISIAATWHSIAILEHEDGGKKTFFIWYGRKDGRYQIMQPRQLRINPDNKKK